MASDTRPRLLAALKQLAATQDPASITHRQLAAESGLSVPTVQKHLGAPENFPALLAQEAASPAADTRERILAAASRVFAAKGYTSASLDMVAREAGLTKGAIYWNFRSKAELFYELVEQRCNQDNAAIDPMLDMEQLQHLDLRLAQDVIEQVVRQVSQDPHWPRLFVEFLSQTREPEVAERLSVLYRNQYASKAQLHDALKAMGRIDSSIDSTVLARFWVALVDGLLMAWMANPQDTDLPLLAREFTRIAWMGVRSTSTGDHHED